MKAHKREVPRCLERTSAARRKEENLCLHEDIISSRIRALITAKKRRTAVSYSSAECCLERTNFARTKNRTAAGTSLEAAFSWEGFWRLCEMFAFLSEFFLWTNYSRRKPRRLFAPGHPHKCPQCGHFQGFVTGDNATLFPGSWTHSDAENPKKSVFARASTDVIPAPSPIFAPISGHFYGQS